MQKNFPGCLFPAPAGVILINRSYLEVMLTVPRTRGGDPGIEDAASMTKLCSPHPRG